VRIDLRESQIGHRGRLERRQRVLQADFPGAEFFQQFNGVGRRHKKKIHKPSSPDRKISAHFGEALSFSRRGVSEL